MQIHGVAKIEIRIKNSNPTIQKFPVFCALLNYDKKNAGLPDDVTIDICVITSDEDRYFISYLDLLKSFINTPIAVNLISPAKKSSIKLCRLDASGVLRPFPKSPLPYSCHAIVFNGTEQAIVSLPTNEELTIILHVMPNVVIG